MIDFATSSGKNIKIDPRNVDSCFLTYEDGSWIVNVTGRDKLAVRIDDAETAANIIRSIMIEAERIRTEEMLYGPMHVLPEDGLLKISMSGRTVYMNPDLARTLRSVVDRYLAGDDRRESGARDSHLEDKP